MTRTLALTADIGGTHSRLALSENGALRPDTIHRFRNDDHADFSDILTSYLRESGARPSALCLAAAGPVTNEGVTLTNRAWVISKSDLATLSGCRDITLINDLQAMGYALAVPEIATGPLTRTRLVLAIGTGINAAVAHPHAGKVYVPPGETGYISLPFTTQADASLLARIATRFGAPAVESVLSGAGLSRTHHALSGTSRAPQEITAAKPHPDTAPTLALVLRVLGATLGSLALIHLPFGGLYLAGSVGRALFAHLDSPDFQAHYAQRGAYSDLMNSFPIRLISDDTAPLHGAAICLAQGQTGNHA